MKPGVPIQAAGVLVDHLSAQAGEAFLTANLPAPGHALAVAPIEVLIYLTLKSPRMKDRAEVVELLKAGADVRRCRAWLEKNAPSMVASLEDAAATATSEE